MAKFDNLSDLFTAIANAIRSKTGSTNSIVAADFPDAIASISSGSDAGAVCYVYDPNREYAECSIPFIGRAIKLSDDIIVAGDYTGATCALKQTGLISGYEDLPEYVSGILIDLYILGDETGVVLDLFPDGGSPIAMYISEDVIAAFVQDGFVQPDDLTPGFYFFPYSLGDDSVSMYFILNKK